MQQLPEIEKKGRVCMNEQIRERYLNLIATAYTEYQELHVHTTASFRDGINTIPGIFDQAEKMGRKAVAVTDHGNMLRLFPLLKERTRREKKHLERYLAEQGLSAEKVAQVLKAIGPFDTLRAPSEKMWPYIEEYPDAFVKAAHTAVQAIPGVEIYTGELDSEKAYHMVLYAKDWEGVKALFKLTNLGQLKQNKKGTPRVTHSDMVRVIGAGGPGHGHVIGTSACIGGLIPQTLIAPWENGQKIRELEEKIRVQESECGYHLDDIDSQKKEIAELTEKARDAKKVVTQVKKAPDVLPKAEAKLKTAEKRLAAASAKLAESSQQLSFGSFTDEAKDAEQFETAERQYEEARKQVELLKMYIETPDRYIQQAEQYQVSLDSAKKHLDTITTALKPLGRLMKRLEALKETVVDFDTSFAKALEIAKDYGQIFGQGNFFIELQCHGIDAEEFVRPYLVQIAKDAELPMTVANDVHFQTREQKQAHLLIAATRFPDLTVYDLEKEQGAGQYYFKSNEEMAALVPQDYWQTAMKGPAFIAQMCNVTYHKEMHLPQFDCQAAGFPTSIEYLESFARKMIPQKYPMDGLSEEEKQARMEQIETRLRYELDIIKKMGYDSYIAIVQDFIFYGRKIGGPLAIGPGRGSAAGSIVCYLVDITDIDPLRYNLLFERFLNPERVSMPDIDTDIAPKIRGKVIEYVTQKYAWKDKYDFPELKSTVCNIVTENKLNAKAAIRSAARVLGMPLSMADKAAKQVPTQIGITIQKALDTVPEFKELYDNDAGIKEIIDAAILMEGIPSQSGVHAAGVIIADRPVCEYAPMFWNTEQNCWVIQADMVSCEMDIGCLKMDFLGLKNLDILNLALAYVKKSQGKVVDVSRLSAADDTAVIENIYGAGETIGVFQFEGAGITKAVTGFQPKTIDDVILMNAAYRPGPMQFIPDVTEVKFGRKKPNYICPEMAPILEKTYGSAIYQEQIMQIFHDVAGLSMGKADIVRRAMSKKHLDELEAEKQGFVDGLLKKGASQQDIDDFWDKLLAFAAYAFNRSHAAAYSVISYYTAWLKYYYPGEFYAALLSFTPFEKFEAYQKEAARRGINIVLPNVNESVPCFAPRVGGKEIRYGLQAIKQVASAATAIYENRRKWGPYKDLHDFIVRASMFGLSTDVATAIVFAGALDTLSPNRRQTNDVIANSLDECKGVLKKIRKETPDISDEETYHKLSSMWTLANNIIEDDFSPMERLRKEYEYVGMYLSGNPVMPYEQAIRRNAEHTIADVLANGEAQTSVTLCGMIFGTEVNHRKSDGAAFGKFTLTDLSGSAEIVVFTKAFRDNRPFIEDGKVVKVYARLMNDGEKITIAANQIIPIP